MINKNELKTLLDQIRIVTLARIQKLSEAAGLLDNINMEIDSNVDDAYLKELIKIKYYYKKTLDDLDNDWRKDDQQCWDRLFHIDD